MHFHPMVNLLPIQHSRNEVITYTLHLVHLDVSHIQWLRLGQHTSVRVNCHDLALRQPLMHFSCNSCQSTSCSGWDDDSGHFLVCLVENLLASRVVMSHRIWGIAILVQENDIRVLFYHPLGHTNQGSWSIPRIIWSPDDFGTQSSQNILLLLTHLLWHGDK